MEYITSFFEKVPWNTQSVIQLCVHIVLALAVYFVGTKIIKRICRVLRSSLERTNTELSVTQFIVSFVKAALYAFLIIMIAVNLGVKESSIAALLASAGVGVSLALQGGLSNLAGGLLILFLKPFQIGDYIMENTDKQEGTVTKIEMFYTTLLTIDQRRITIPNGVLMNTSIINYSAQERRIIDLKVGISYDSDIKKAKEILQDIIDKEERILSDEDVKIFVSELADSAVIIGLRAWVKTTDFWPTKWQLLEEIKFQFDEQGIQIPYPQMDVHVKS